MQDIGIEVALIQDAGYKILKYVSRTLSSFQYKSRDTVDFKKNFGLLFIFILAVPAFATAGGVADFSAGSKSKITLNPAGAALIDRILFNVTAFEYEGGNQLSPFNNQFSEDGSSTYIQAGYSNSFRNYFDTVDYIEFENGQTEGLHFDLAYPTAYFTIGGSVDHRGERYEDGYFVSTSGIEYDNLSADTKADHKEDVVSYFLAIPYRNFSFGVRQNRKKTSYRFYNIDDFRFHAYKGFWVSSSKGIYHDGQIEGEAEYTYNDYGVILHVNEDSPLLDINLFYRPSTEAKFEFEDLTINGTSDHGTGFALEDFEFKEPGITLIGINLANRNGNVLSQLMLEVGDYLEVDDSLDYLVKESKSQRDRAFDIMGYLVRIAYKPYLDIAYGYKSHEIAGSLTEVTTIGLKFPVPFYKDLILTLGTSQIKVSNDEEEVVAENRSYRFSFELKIGKPVVKRGRVLAPKTKTLPPDFP